MDAKVKAARSFVEYLRNRIGDQKKRGLVDAVLPGHARLVKELAALKGEK